MASIIEDKPNIKVYSDCCDIWKVNIGNILIEEKGAWLGQMNYFLPFGKYKCYRVSKYSYPKMSRLETRSFVLMHMYSQHKKASNHHANLPLEMYSFTL